MRSGRNRAEVQILHMQEGTTDEYGVPATTWPVFIEANASVFIKRGGEQFKNGVSYSADTAVFTFRYEDVDGINSTMRINFDGQLYEIKSILPDLMKHESTIVDAVIYNAQQGGTP
ncbi:phage head closure protein [Pleomorphomonas sp. PLEO]|uniref:phage head closure protein n=1 Tax=Pleomorphomonas sp. PLEO TaxID=3239306 RepID=UPI00351EEBAB